MQKLIQKDNQGGDSPQKSKIILKVYLEAHAFGCTAEFKVGKKVEKSCFGFLTLKRQNQKKKKKRMMVFYGAWVFSTSQRCCKNECKNITATMSELFRISSIPKNMQITLELLIEVE